MSLRVGMISLGCPKNLVDAEIMLGHLREAGFAITAHLEEAEVIIVNTCGFITPAKEESIEEILRLARYKEDGRCRVLLVAGCLAQRYPGELMEEMPEVDGLLGTGMIHQVARAVQRALAGERVLAVGDPGCSYEGAAPRLRATPRYTAYLKIAEGCSNCCTYCAIPLIRGPYRSRPLEDVVAEARKLAAEGAREIILVAQDTTRYGLDLYGQRSLPRLLKELTEVPGITWLRLMYCHPEGITEELIEVLSSSPKICRYIDLPLQHASPAVLERMGRGATAGRLREIIGQLREAIPGLVMRTTFMVGFPGEREEDFQQLCDFMREMRFERAGLFKYSAEEGTPAAALPDQVPEEVKEERYHRAMSLQRQISLAYHRSLVGTSRLVLVEGRRGRRYVGRSEGDAPEVDGRVIFSAHGSPLSPGEFVKVKITRAREYDLVGELA
ncbi:30S ribosomal protein S12 methylthiotransferase RimO [Desulfovirgula thermocuniculi]|uniref:30S ribosomal protein S12 methylthiotransferase RimO n=1 Tax=Desulfovirgula thermocuniculi TaxID=348842 RepID=UPI00041E7319|nr:30S ribosomal protein S12 methylthiotransferase RimO [Desulfovirgula thermocuniculi]